MISIRLVLLFCAISALFATASAEAATLTVMSNADAGGTCPGATCTLRQAIATAALLDTIDFAVGIATITLTSGELAINKNLTISGPGANRLTVQRSAAAGTPAFSVMRVVSGAGSAVYISGLTLTNGSSSEGGGLFVGAGSVYLSNCAVAGNSATQYGGGIRNTFGQLSIANCTVSGNSSSLFGGGVSNGSFGTTITNSTISGNSAVDGAGINVGGFFHMSSSTVTDNHATGFGGGMRVEFGTPDLKSTIIAQNTAAGGAPDLYSFSGSVTSNGFNLIGNGAGANMIPAATDKVGTGASPINPLLGPLQDNGGPTRTHALLSGSPAIEAGQANGTIADQRGFARPVDSAVVVNAAGGDGSDIGAYEMQADILPGCSSINRIVANGNDSGADSLRDVISKVCAGSTITFAASVAAVTLTSAELAITRSLSIVGPGANLLNVQRSSAMGTPNFRIFNVAGGINVTISGLTVANGNNPGQQGGGIRNAGSLALTGVAIAGNTANLGGNGGGIYNAGTLAITGSTISNNSVSSITGAGSGGGIFNFGGAITIVNSTLSANFASGPGGTSDSGGGIFSNVGTVALVNSTITGNAGDLGGGVRGANGAVVTAKNTIIALNTSPSGPDVNGPLDTQGFNLIGETSGMTVSQALLSDQLGVTSGQLNLGPLQFNGGATQTHALLAGSFARDKGQSSAHATDQRGRVRPVDLASVANAADGDGSDIGAFEFSDLSIDIDGDGNYDALTDGLLIIRYLFGLTGNPLTSNAIGNLPLRSTPQDILQYLDGIRPALDVDGNTEADALTDGLMIIRYLFGLRAPSLTAGAIGSNPARDAAAIETYIQSLMP